MGELERHPIRAWRERYGLRALLETGTNMGNGVVAALAAGYPSVVTIDVNAGCQGRIARRVPEGQQGRVSFVCGDSAEVLPDVLASLPRPALLWLDAHYPDVYLPQAGATASTLPLLAEVRALVAAERDHSGDVILADDLRIYGTLGTSGPLPDRSGEHGPGHARSVPLERGAPGDLEEVRALLAPTHDMQVIRKDGAYLLATPRGGR